MSSESSFADTVRFTLYSHLLALPKRHMKRKTKRKRERKRKEGREGEDLGTRGHRAREVACTSHPINLDRGSKIRGVLSRDSPPHDSSKTWYSGLLRERRRVVVNPQGGTNQQQRAQRDRLPGGCERGGGQGGIPTNRVCPVHSKVERNRKRERERGYFSLEELSYPQAACPLGSSRIRVTSFH